MKSGLNKHKASKGGLWIALTFLFIGFTKAQSTYPINDPRNPDCPCHKYQKLAEEEYKKLQASSNNTIVKDKEIGISEESKEKKNKVNEVKSNEVGVSNDAKAKINQINDDKQSGISDEGQGMNKVFIPNESDNIQGKINEEDGGLNVNEQKITRSGNVSRAPQYTTSKHWKGKRKKHRAFYKQMKRIFYVGGWDIWKRKRITSACYHWR